MVDLVLQALMDPAVLPPIAVAGVLVCIKLASVWVDRKAEHRHSS